MDLIGELTIFVLASGLCGIAPSLNALIGFRVLQGFGAGHIDRRMGGGDHPAAAGPVRRDGGAQGYERCLIQAHRRLVEQP